MFESLAEHARILVTGPQRSGTTIAARMIAHDTGYLFVPEERFGTDKRRAFEGMLKSDHFSVQCPTMCRWIHEYADDETLVVMMIRDTDNIRASEERISWGVGAYPELMRYGMSIRQARSFRLRGREIAPIKYAYWRDRQRSSIPHWLELEYESLSEHPLWVPKEERACFRARQIER